VSCKWTVRKTGRKECLGHVQNQSRFCFRRELSLKRNTEVVEKYEAVENLLDKHVNAKTTLVVIKKLAKKAIVYKLEV